MLVTLEFLVAPGDNELGFSLQKMTSRADHSHQTTAPSIVTFRLLRAHTQTSVISPYSLRLVRYIRTRQLDDYRLPLPSHRVSLPPRS